MRVLHLTDVYGPQVGGIEVFVADLAARQAACHDVSVLTPTRATPTDTPHAAGATEVFRVGLSSALRRDPSEFDVVHAHLSVLSPYTTALSARVAATGTPLAVTVHSLWGGRTPFVRSAGALAGWRRWPAAWTAVSEVAAADVRRLTKRDVTVVPNAVDVAWWRDNPRSRRSRPFTIVCVMRLAPRKRPLALLQVLRRLRAVVPETTPLRAVLVGDGPLAAQLDKTSARLGLSSWVELTGALDRAAIRGQYSSADVFVAPAHRESFGIAALEARAAGIPVVAMRSGGVGEFVRDGVEGLLCEDDDHLVRALAHLATAPHTLAAMARHNHDVPPPFDWDRVVDGLDEVYASARDAAAARRRRRVLAPRVRTGAASG